MAQCLGVTSDRIHRDRAAPGMEAHVLHILVENEHKDILNLPVSIWKGDHTDRKYIKVYACNSKAFPMV